MNNKKYKIWSSDWTETVNIEDSFLDPFSEACTRVVEKSLNNKNKMSLKINPVLICQCLDTNEQKTMNSYKILQNAGFYKIAEFLRNYFYEESEVDLADEPLSSSMKHI
jgi:hypothetical protein